MKMECVECGRSGNSGDYCPECGSIIALVPEEGDKELRYINYYEIVQSYGGPEGGGWWYDCGEPLASIPYPVVYKNMRTGCYTYGLTEVSNTEEYPDIEKLIALFDMLMNQLYGPKCSRMIQRHKAEPFPKYTPRYE